MWSQLALLKSHYVVCTDSHVVRHAGVYKILWPQCFVFFVFNSFAFSQLFVIVNLMYLVRQTTFLVCIIFYFSILFFNPKAVLVTECWRLVWLQPTVLLCCCFFSFSVQRGWLSFGNELFWIVVTDNGVTQSVVLKEPFWNFDGRCDKSPVPSCFPQQQRRPGLSPPLNPHLLHFSTH